MNFWRAHLFGSLIFCKTYKYKCNMWFVMCDVWYVMFQTCFFVTSWLNESSGDQKYPIWVISVLLNHFQNWSQVTVVFTLYLARPLMNFFAYFFVTKFILRTTVLSKYLWPCNCFAFFCIFFQLNVFGKHFKLSHQKIPRKTYKRH